MNKKSTKISAGILSVLTLSLMLCFFMPGARAAGDLINRTAITDYTDWQASGIGTHGVQWGGSADKYTGAINAWSNGNSYSCYQMIASSTYNQPTQDVTLHIYVYVSGLTYSESVPALASALEKIHLRLVDLTSAQTIYDSTSLDWRATAGGLREFTPSGFPATLYQGHTYVLYAGPHVETTSSIFGSASASASGTIQQMRVYY